MKKVLIITSSSRQSVAWREREPYVRDFCEAVTAKLANVQVVYTTYQDLQFTVVGGRTQIYDTRNNIDLKDVDLVHFKNWVYDPYTAPVVAMYLHRYEVTFFNSEVHTTQVPGKLGQMFLLAENDVPVPDTLYASKERLQEYFEHGTLPEGFAYPLIMKANDGSKGDDNHLVKDAEQAIDILTASDPEKEYVLQCFIPNDGDYRLLYIGLGGEPLIFHRRGVEGSHLNNTSKGGTGTFVPQEEFPAEYGLLARRAAELLGREIGGVDVLVDKVTGQAYVLEVNATPALATGYGTDVKVERFARFLQDTLDAEEEE